MNDLKERGIGFRSLQEHIDTTTSGGKLVFHVFGALAEFERDLIRERTKAGLAAARARGRWGGRRALSAEKVRQLRTLAADRANSVPSICRTLESRGRHFTDTLEVCPPMTKLSKSGDLLVDLSPCYERSPP